MRSGNVGDAQRKRLDIKILPTLTRRKSGTENYSKEQSNEGGVGGRLDGLAALPNPVQKNLCTIPNRKIKNFFVIF